MKKNDHHSSKELVKENFEHWEEPTKATRKQLKQAVERSNSPVEKKKSLARRKK